MKPAAFDYEAPTEVAAAVELLAASEGAGKVVAGCQSLGPMLNLRLAQPSLLVDVRGIPALQEVSEADGGGAGGSWVTHAAIEGREGEDGPRGGRPAGAREGGH